MSEVRRNNDCVDDSCITVPEALGWDNDVAELSIATDFRLRELHGKVKFFFCRSTEFCVGGGRPRRQLRSNVGEGGPVCSHQQRPHFVPQSVLHCLPIQRSPPTFPLKHFCLSEPSSAPLDTTL